MEGVAARRWLVSGVGRAGLPARVAARVHACVRHRDVWARHALHLLVCTRANLKVALRADALLAARAAVEPSLIVEHADGTLFAIVTRIILAAVKRRKPSLEDHLPERALFP